MSDSNLYQEALNFTEKQIDNVVNCWEVEGDKAFKTYQSLLKLGDSKKVAFASALEEKYKESNYDFYYNAYCL